MLYFENFLACVVDVYVCALNDPPGILVNGEVTQLKKDTYTNWWELLIWSSEGLLLVSTQYMPFSKYPSLAFVS